MKKQSSSKVKRRRELVISDEEKVRRAIRNINKGKSGIRVMSALAPELQAKVKKQVYKIKMEYKQYKKGIKKLTELSPLTRELYGLNTKKRKK